MPVKSHRLGPGSLKLGATGSEVEFATALKSAKLAEDVKEGDLIPLLSGDELEEGDDLGFTLSGTVLQQYDLDSLIVWCHVNAGTDQPFTFRPDDDKPLSFKGTVRIRRLDVGGDAKARNTSDFSFKGKAGTMYELVDASAADAPVTVYNAAAPATPNDGSTWF